MTPVLISAPTGDLAPLLVAAYGLSDREQAVTVLVLQGRSTQWRERSDGACNIAVGLAVVGSTVAPWEIAERSVGARGTVMELDSVATVHSSSTASPVGHRRRMFGQPPPALAGRCLVTRRLARASGSAAASNRRHDAEAPRRCGNTATAGPAASRLLPSVPPPMPTLIPDARIEVKRLG